MTINLFTEINNMINEALDNMYTAAGDKPVVLSTADKDSTHPVVREYQEKMITAINNTQAKMFGV